MSARNPTTTYTLPPDLSIDVIGDRIGLEFSIAEHPLDPGELIYYDTFDARLWRCGIRLRGRVLPRATHLTLTGSQFDETEVVTHRVDFARNLPRGALRDVVADLIGVRTLIPRVECGREGKKYQLLDAREKTVLRFSLELMRARRPGDTEEAPSTPLLLMSPLRGYEAERDRFERFVRESLGGYVASRGRLGAGLVALGARELENPSEFVLDLDPEVSVVAGARQVAAALLRVVRATEAGVIAELDTEFLHDFRVAVRRTRSILGQLRSHLPADEVTPLLEELSWLAQGTGPCRDLDVFQLQLQSEAATDPRMEPCVEKVRARRKRDLAKLRSLLRSERYRALIVRWGEFSRPNSSSDSSSEPTLRNAISEQARARMKKLVARVRKGLAREDDTLLHRARVDAKKLRYLFDCSKGVFPAGDVKSFVVELKRIQDELGDLNDAVVQEEMLTALAEELCASPSPSAATLLAMGGEIERTRRRGRRARSRFEDRWRRFFHSDAQPQFAALTEMEPFEDGS